jgi:hypothetical protein
MSSKKMKFTDKQLLDFYGDILSKRLEPTFFKNFIYLRFFRPIVTSKALIFFTFLIFSQ